MRATVIHAPGDVRLEEVPKPEVQFPGDAVVRIVAACVCGSDLWRFRGIEEVHGPSRMGHEGVGVVESVGEAVTAVKPGDFVVIAMYNSCGECAACRRGVTCACLSRSFYGMPSSETSEAGAQQAEYLRIPRADANLEVVEGFDPTTEAGRALIPSLLTLADVMGTGWHAALSAGVTEGSTVAVVGDGAVGLCGVIAAKQLGASRIVAMSRHADRQALATKFGATDIVEERGDAGVAKLKEMFDGVGPDCVLECVGTKESMAQAIGSCRPGGVVGFVGVPAGGPELPVGQLFDSNVGVRGGLAAVRDHVKVLLPLVMDGTITPGDVFDLQVPLAEVADAYRAMDERRATKVLLWA